VEAVHIFGGQHGVEQRLGIDLFGQRKLDEDAVDVVDPLVDGGGVIGSLKRPRSAQVCTLLRT
jgi:hypothetical protein